MSNAIDRPTAEETRAELTRLLESAELAGSRQRRSFLKYVVDETLAGRADRLKERNIAIKALGRDRDFDPTTDCVVRMAARRLRRALDRYYTGEGADNPVRISIPKGGYESVACYADVRRSCPAAGSDALPHSTAHVANDDRPVVAVTPWLLFTNSDQEQFLAESIAQDTAIGLSKIGWLRVIDYVAARSLSAKGHAPLEIASRLHSDFLVTGTVRQKGSSVRVTTQLLEIPIGTIIWADTSDLAERPEEVSSYDSTVRHIVEMIGDLFGALGQALWSRIDRKPIKDLTALEAVLCNCDYQCRLDDSYYPLVLEASEWATKTNPHFAWGWAARADLCVSAFGHLAPRSRENVVELGLHCARQALGLDPAYAYAHWVMAWCHLLQGRIDETIAGAEQTAAHVNASPFEIGGAGALMSMAGEHRRGQQLIDEAIAANPRLPGWTKWCIVINHLAVGDYSAALRVADDFSLPQCFWDPMLRGAIFNRLGKTAESRVEVQRARQLRPFLAENPRQVIGRILRSSAVRDDLLDSLGTVGLSTGRQP